MKKPILTIGMPTCYDYSGALLSVVALKEYQSFSDGDIEILVIDNTPDDEYSSSLKKQIKGFANPLIRYEEFKEKRGPAESKNQVFERATGEYVICMDSHVMFDEGSIARLKEFLKDLPEDQKDDFFTGPLKGNEGNYSTHFKDIWRGEMWGIWETDKTLLETDELKPIWAQGCGLMLVRRESWLGFNKNFKGFGGEEGYIHEKYRKAGREVYLIPWLGWWHRFGNPDTKHYNLTRYSKVRNYVLGHLELEKDLKPIYDHFVNTEITDKYSKDDLIKHLMSEHSVSQERLKGAKNTSELQNIHKLSKLPEHQWEWILKDPEKNEEPLVDEVADTYSQYLESPSNDLAQHFPILSRFASVSKTVAEISRRQTSSIALLKGNPESLMSYTFETRINNVAVKQKNFTGLDVGSFDNGVTEFLRQEPVDTLFLKFPHSHADPSDMLSQVSENVNKYIILHDTEADYKPEMVQAMKDLVATEGWHVLFHSNKQWGMTVLSTEKPPNMVFAWTPEPGVGAEVKKLLKKIGIEASKNCACNRHAMIMDYHGPEWCLENMDTILEWLEVEAKKKKMPFIKAAGRILVKRAIRNHKRIQKKELQDVV